MKIEKLKEILSNPSISQKVSSLQTSSINNIPKWVDLEKHYNPMKHNIWDTNKYPPKIEDGSVMDDFKRTAFGLQKLAVSRVAQSMFGDPVNRSYNYDYTNEKAKEAAAIIEEVYKTRNHIDSENISRAKKLNACCEICTVWRVTEEETIIGENKSQFTLSHKTYSSMDGYTFFPILDSFGDLICISIMYSDTDNVGHMFTYANFKKEGAKSYHFYQDQGEWVEESINVDFFPAVYIYTTEPVWGAQENNVIIEALEEMESYQGLYVKRNALPTFTLDYGEVTEGETLSTDKEKNSDSKRVIRVGKGGGMKDVTWTGAGEAVSQRFSRLRNSFFEQTQVPDTSFATMISSNTSAENKELVFADAKAKALEIGGIWEMFFYSELEIVKKFISVMFSSYKGEIEKMSIRSQLRPYSIKTRKENAEYVSTAADSMSLSTKIKVLGEVDDISAEQERIQEEKSIETNQLQ